MCRFKPLDEYRLTCPDVTALVQDLVWQYTVCPVLPDFAQGHRSNGLAAFQLGACHKLAPGNKFKPIFQVYFEWLEDPKTRTAV